MQILSPTLSRYSRTWVRGDEYQTLYLDSASPYPLYPPSGASAWAPGGIPSYRHPVRHLFVNVRYQLFPRELWNANFLICILVTLCILRSKLLTQISTQTLAGVDLSLYHRLAEVQSIEIQQGRRKQLEFGWTMYPMGQ